MSIALGNKIKFLREKHNLSQSSLGELVSLSPQFISLIERGKRNTSDENLEKFSEFFKVSLNELLALKEEALSYPNKQEQIGPPTFPTHIQDLVDILLKIEEEDCKNIVNDLLQQITERFYHLLNMYSHRDIKQEVLKIRSNWINLNVPHNEQEEVNIRGCIKLENPMYFSLIQTNNVLQLTLLPTDFSHAKMFEEWLDKYQVSYTAEETIPHMTSKQKVFTCLWFSPFISSFDKYNYLLSKGLELDDVECNDVQLSWLIQAKKLNDTRLEE